MVEPITTTSSIALSQAAPDSNVLFIAVLGWNLGLNAGHSVAWALFGVGVCLFATLLPSSVLTYTATRWAHHNRDKRSVKAFKQGLAPVVIAAVGHGLAAVVTHAGVMACRSDHAHRSMAGFFEATTLISWALTAVVVVLIYSTRLHMLWLLGLGGLCGVMGWV